MSTQPSRWVRALPVVAYVAGAVMLAWRGHTLAADALGLHTALAWALPLLVDVYVVAAFIRRGPDRWWAMGLMGLVFAASVTLDAARAGGLASIHVVEVALGCAIVLAMWRVTELVHGRHDDEVQAAAEEARAAARETRRRATRPEAGKAVVVAAPAVVAGGEVVQDAHDDGFPAAPWPVSDAGDEMAIQWLLTVPPAPTGAALAARTQWSRDGRRVRRLVAAAVSAS